jgi:hypothetical protein
MLSSPNNPLLTLPNVVLSPHTAGTTPKALMNGLNLSAADASYTFGHGFDGLAVHRTMGGVEGGRHPECVELGRPAIGHNTALEVAQCPGNLQHCRRDKPAGSGLATLMRPPCSIRSRPTRSARSISSIFCIPPYACCQVRV